MHLGRILILSLSAAVAILLTASSTVAQSLVAVDLGTLGGSRSQATAVNNKGHVVGWSYLPGDTAYHAFLWTREQGMIDLGTLGGTDSVATALNDQDQVVGWARGPSFRMHAFSWTQSGGMVDLGTLGHWWGPSQYTQGSASWAVAVNENGQVVGDSYIRDDSSYLHAFSWTQSSGIVDLGTVPLFPEPPYLRQGNARAISETGQVVGSSYSGWDTDYRAFSWTASAGIIDLGTLGGDESGASAVNNKGQVVGSSQIAGNASWHAFSWTAAGGMLDLGTLGGSNSAATALNDLGQVVGRSEIAVGNTATHAFSWTAAGGMVDLGETAPGTRTIARAVSETGHVFGEGYIPASGYPSHDAFVWTPGTGMTVLGSLGADSNVTDVSVNGYFVGSQPAGDPGQHAMLWQVQKPVISSASATPDVLWPPNRQLIPVSIAVSASDASGVDPACEISTVSSNETPTTAGEPDWTVTSRLTVSLRAARGGNGNDRLYTATVTCTNVAGLSETKEVTVRVPHDASR